MGRLTGLLRRGDSRSAFVVAGEALAAGLLATRRDVRPPEALEQLADAMVGSLMLVEAATSDSEDADRRVRLAMATATLSVARPHTARVCDAVISLWMGMGIGSPRRMENPYALAARVLLALLLDDTDDAADSVDALLDIDRAGVSGILHDWVVARIQGHGADREAQCFHHLRVSLAHAPGGGGGSALVLLGAIVLVDGAGRPRREVLPWLEAIAAEVEQHGTTRLAARAS